MRGETRTGMEKWEKAKSKRERERESKREQEREILGEIELRAA